MNSAATSAWLPTVVVQWVDSASVNHGLWTAHDEIDPTVMTLDGLTQRTVGFVINESDDVLLLAQSVGDQLGAVLAIPKVAIRARSEVKP